MDLRTFIKESVKREIKLILREGDRKDFSMEELLACQTPNDAKHYLYNTLNYFAEGTYRIVFVVDDKRIIKQGMTDKGIKQNKREVENSRCLPKEYVVQVYDHHPEFWWVIEERVETLDEVSMPNLFLKKTGFQRLLLDSNIIMKLIVGAVDELQSSPYIDDLNESFLENAWYAGFINAITDCGVGYKDFHPGNWGFRPSTGDLVLLDLGF
jgi:hypothetical protein